MNKKKVAILISGNGSNMSALIKDMEDPSHPARPAVVIADRPETYGIELAKSKNIETKIVNFNDFSNNLDFEKKITQLIKNSESRVVCLAGFMRIFSPYFISAFENRILNIHPSILPLFKGLNTHLRALNSGMTIHGATVHLVTEKLDDGKILGQGVIPILKDDTVTTLGSRALKLEHKLYPLVLRNYLINNTDKILISEIGKNQPTISNSEKK